MQTRAPRLEPVWPRGSCIFLCALVLFVADKVKPALLHGDLWIGNTGAIADAGPIIFDPACFFGHSEYDLAIMSIFGGFSREFFEAYHHLIPRAPGFENREKVYRLYHLFNQVPIFYQQMSVRACVRACVHASLVCFSLLRVCVPLSSRVFQNCITKETLGAQKRAADTCGPQLNLFGDPAVRSTCIELMREIAPDDEEGAETV